MTASMPSTLPSLFTAPPSLPAVTIPSTAGQPITLTYPALARSISLLTASLLSLPTSERPHHGSVISSSLTNSLEFVIAFFSTTSSPLRCVSAPLNPAYKEDEVAFYLRDTGASILLVGPETKSSDATVRAGKQCGVPVYAVHLELDAQGGEVKQVNLRKLAGAGARTHVQVANKDQENGGDVKPDDVALVLHTSGTTGRPKGAILPSSPALLATLTKPPSPIPGVPLTHLNLLTTMTNIAKWYELTPSDRGLLVMPLFHGKSHLPLPSLCFPTSADMFVLSRLLTFRKSVHGLVCGLLAPLVAKSSVVIPPRFSANSFWSDFTSQSCDWYTAVPTIHSILLSLPAPTPLPHIRFIRSCSSSLSPTTFHALEKTFQAPVLEAYAMSEAAHMMTGSPLPSNGPRYPGSVGKPAGVELTIRDPSTGREVPGRGDGSRGEVCIRGKNVMLGYLNNDKANKEGYWDGEREGKESRWFRTGDEGYLTEDGYLILTGRLKEVRGVAWRRAL